MSPPLSLPPLTLSHSLITLLGSVILRWQAARLRCKANFTALTSSLSSSLETELSDTISSPLRYSFWPREYFPSMKYLEPRSFSFPAASFRSSAESYSHECFTYSFTRYKFRRIRVKCLLLCTSLNIPPSLIHCIPCWNCWVWVQREALHLQGYSGLGYLRSRNHTWASLPHVHSPGSSFDQQPSQHQGADHTQTLQWAEEGQILPIFRSLTWLSIRLSPRQQSVFFSDIPYLQFLQYAETGELVFTSIFSPQVIENWSWQRTAKKCSINHRT